MLGPSIGFSDGLATMAKQYEDVLVVQEFVNMFLVVAPDSDSM
jgi:hypothetical protein